ncbi:MAG: sugar phosphorylase [Treponema sp.]|jgi:sucrose phosphorylase|nr:sugar phosphorylase [Treponema sp.]
MKKESVFFDLLSFLYGKEKAETIRPRLEKIIASYSGRFPKPSAETGLPFTHKDAFLISYGNMLSAPEGSVPRGTLRGTGEENAGKAGAASAGKPAEESGDSLTGLERLYRFLKKRDNGEFTFLHILPFHPYSSDDGFSVIDYRKVDPRFGSWEDLENLRTLGIKLVFDLVINHGSVQSAWFTSFLAGDERYAGWYLTRPKDYDYSTVTRPRTHPLLTPFSRKVRGRKTPGKDAEEETVYAWTTFSEDQVDYDFSNPDVLLEFITILLEYASRGAGIVRLDAIAYLWKEDGTSCLHHPKTHAVVKLFRAVIDYLDLPVLILTETNVPHEENISYFGKALGQAALDFLPEAHMVYNFALPPLCLHAAVSGDAAPLRAWAKTLPGPEKRQYFLNFLASHDGVGLTPVKGLVDEKAFAATLEEARRRGALVSYKSTSAGDVPYELNCSYGSIVAPPDADWARDGGAEIRARAFLAVHAVLFSLSGLPAVYFHSWTGSPAWKEGPDLLGYNRAINREKPPVDRLEAELDDPASFRFHVYRGFAKLLSFRQNEEAFDPSYDQVVLDASGAVFALLRTWARSEKGSRTGEGRSLLCVVNLSPRETEWKLSPEDSRRYPLPAECEKIRLDPWESVWVSFEGGGITSRLSTVKE